MIIYTVRQNLVPFDVRRLGSNGASALFSKFESTFDQLEVETKTIASTYRCRPLLGFPRLYSNTSIDDYAKDGGPGVV